MPKVKISEYSATANSNTDVASINIDEGCAPSGINNAIRAIMGHLKDFQQGTNGDPFNGPVNGTVGATTPSTGAFTSLTTTGTINLITVGRGAGAVATNTAVGANALAANSTGAEVTAIGRNALAANTVNYGTAVGANALTANTTGAANAAFGFGALTANTTGGNNVAVGESALGSNTTASNNTAVGYQAGYSQTNSITGGTNTFIGAAAGYSSTGNVNTFVGQSSGYSVSSGSGNAFFGRDSGYFVTTGSKNTILGGYTGNAGGLDIRTASNYIVLSDGDGNPRGVFDSSGFLGFGAAPTTSLTNTIGINAIAGPLGYYQSTRDAVQGAYNRVTTDGDILVFYRQSSGVGSISVTTTATAYNTSSDYRLKNTIAPMKGALAKVALLKPCTYKWNVDGSDGQGFIAHELAEVVPHAVTGTKDGVDEEGNPKYQGIDVSFLVAILTAAIQEQQALITKLTARITALEGASA